MKRDMELIKNLMLYIEDRGSLDGMVLSFRKPPELMQWDPALTGQEIEKHVANMRHHVSLLASAGFIDLEYWDGGETAFIRGLTWPGSEFLDNARDPKVWNAAIKNAGHLSWGVLTSVLNSTACEAAKKMLSGQLF